MTIDEAKEIPPALDEQQLAWWQISITCPHCHTTFIAGRQHRGVSYPYTCPKCHTNIFFQRGKITNSIHRRHTPTTKKGEQK